MQTDDCTRERQLAAAGFPDEPQRTPAGEREAHARDRRQGSGAAPEHAAAHGVVLAQVLHP